MTEQPATEGADTPAAESPPPPADTEQGAAQQAAVEQPAADGLAQPPATDDSCEAQAAPEPAFPEQVAAADKAVPETPAPSEPSNTEKTPADSDASSKSEAAEDGTAADAAGDDASAEQPAGSEKPSDEETTVTSVAPSAAAPPPAVQPARAKKEKKKSKKDREREKKEKAFKDYFDFQEDLSRLMPHRILAINRGERAKVLRVRIEADTDQMIRESEKLLIPADHPHADFLKGVIRDALTRLLIPSLEREIRRELTDKAEAHAVEVFARNLRHLLLTPPLHAHRVLAIDPGFRSGCKMAALDEFGNVLGHGVIHLVGREERRRKARYRLAEIIRLHRLSVVGIGNGSACREVEQLVADVIADELKDLDVQYCIVNEAGASVYSTSGIGREELPDYDATLRSAISIGRRLLDPLSELVKINPANIGVGLYQHDVKVKHLRESLDAVVESCVNYVGVDVNTASPALLRYVSGLNQLTARRLYDYRLQNGPFKNRQQLRNVPGFGAATFVQAAGFLKIRGGDNPLDATWIHPESYDTARRVLERLHSSVSDLPIDEQEAIEAQPAPPGQALPQDQRPAAAPAAEAPAESAPVATAAPAPSGLESVTPEAAPVVEETPPLEGEAVAVAPGAEPPAAADSAAAKSPAPSPSHADLAKRVAEADADQLAQTLEIGKLLAQDILSSLARPTRDPREDLPRPIFRRGIVKIDDLEAGMELAGTVLNVVDFGAFVDIGLNDSALIHVSRLADRYVRDPHDVVSVGDVIRVWVVDVDRQRRRVSLTAIQPGTEKPPAERRGRRAKDRKKADRPPRDRDKSGKPAGQPPAKRAGGRARREFKKPSVKPPYKRKEKPKPVVPITKAMKEGREPMRTFGDLQQFWELQQTKSRKEEETKQAEAENVETKEQPPKEETDSGNESGD
jgi:uncharacterized protein